MDGRTIFIADCHVAADDSALLAALVAFLEDVQGADALYVLGDLFEIWAGPRDLETKAFLPLFDELRSLSESKTPVTFIRGNRDFLLGKTEKDALGLAGVHDELIVELDGMRVLLSHGDLFCVRDRHYQGYRRVIRSRPVKAVLTRIPRGAAGMIGRNMRQRSEDIVRHKGARMTDLAPEALGAAFKKTGAEVIICGHVHRRMERSVTVDGRERTVYVLGTWEKGPSALVYENRGFRWYED